MTRRYGQWAGCPQGQPENTDHCIETVSDDFSPPSRQCGRKRGHGPGGLYCKQHGRMAQISLDRELALRDSRANALRVAMEGKP